MKEPNGRLDKDRLRDFLGLTLNLRKQREEFSNFPKKTWNTVYQKLGSKLTWSWCYELTMIEHVDLLTIAMGLEKQLHEHAQELDYKKIINEWPYSDINIEEGEFSKCFSDNARAALYFSLQRSFESIETYSRSLNALVADVRDGIDSSLFKAVRLDHSATSNPTIDNRISRADLENDKNFFKKLTSSLDGRPKKSWPYYKDLRVILAQLEETETLDSLTIQEAYQLFCIDLKIYPTNGKDPARSLQRYIQKWKINVRATSNRDFRSSPKE